MTDVVIVEAVRTPIGKRGGGLSTLHSTELLGAVQRELITRTGIDSGEVGQVIGGCVGQVGMQSGNVTRNAWLAAGLALEVPATTVDAQCGSAQQATNLAYALVKAGVVEVAVGCGVESMSRVPFGSAVPRDPFVGKPVNRTYWKHYEFTTQFEASERIARRWNVTRPDADEFGKLSQDRLAAAWDEKRFDDQVVAVAAPDLDEGGRPADTEHVVSRDEGLRPTTLDGLAALRPTLAEGIHTAGTSSQVSDGAAAVLLMTREKAETLGLRARASILDVCLVASDPELMLTAPIPATRQLLRQNRLDLGDIDLIEINEAFASVVLAWERELKPDMDRVNPNGGAIAHGHPLGATGAALITKALHELERSDGEHALVTMCCGGGLGTGTLLRRQ